MDQNEIEELKYFSKYFAIGLISLLFFITLTGYVFYSFTEKVLNTILYPLFSALIVLTSFLALIAKTRSINSWNIRYLLAAVFSLFMITSLQLFDWHTANSHSPFQRPIGHDALHLADFFIPIMVISMFLHFESISRSTYNPAMMLLLGFLIFPYLPLTILTIFFNNDDANQLLYDFLPFFAIATLIIVIYSIRVMIKLYFSTVDRQIKRSTVMMISGLFYLVFSFVTQVITPDVINFGFYSAVIFQLMILMLGISMLAISYITNPIFLYASPYKIYSMIVYDEQGNLVWSKNFDSDSELDQQTVQLQAEVMSTIQLLLKQVSGFVGTIQKVEFTKLGRVLIEPIGNYTLIIFCKNTSRQIQVATKQFVDFQLNNLEDHEIQLGSLEKGLELYFPYVLMFL